MWTFEDARERNMYVCGHIVVLLVQLGDGHLGGPGFPGMTPAIPTDAAPLGNASVPTAALDASASWSQPDVWCSTRYTDHAWTDTRYTKKRSRAVGKRRIIFIAANENRSMPRTADANVRFLESSGRSCLIDVMLDERRPLPPPRRPNAPTPSPPPLPLTPPLPTPPPPLPRRRINFRL